MELERRTPSRNPAAPLLPELTKISTPLKVDVWRTALQSHPDRRLAEYIVRGLSTGFRVGFDGSRRLLSAERNLPSATDQARVVTQYIRDEVTLGRVVGPLPISPSLHHGCFPCMKIRHLVCATCVRYRGARSLATHVANSLKE